MVVLLCSVERRERTCVFWRTGGPLPEHALAKSIVLRRPTTAAGGAGFCFNRGPVLTRRRRKSRGQNCPTFRLTIAGGNYDRTRAISGVRQGQGCASPILPLYPEDIFFRSFRYRSRRLGNLVFELPPHGRGRHLVLSRHPAFFRASSAIPASTSAPTPAPSPRILRANASGCPNTISPRLCGCAPVAATKYGVIPRNPVAVTAAARSSPARHEPRRSSRSRPRTQPIGDDQTLVACSKAGELDALFTARAPAFVPRREPHIRALFSDTRAADRPAYSKTDRPVFRSCTSSIRTTWPRNSWPRDQRLQAFLRRQGDSDGDLRDVNALRVSPAVL